MQQNIQIFSATHAENSQPRKTENPLMNFAERHTICIFLVKLGDQDTSWALHIVCKKCKTTLQEITSHISTRNWQTRWWLVYRRSMPTGVRKGTLCIVIKTCFQRKVSISVRTKESHSPRDKSNWSSTTKCDGATNDGRLRLEPKEWYECRVFSAIQRETLLP